MYVCVLQEYAGIDAERLERMEARLKADVLAEAGDWLEGLGCCFMHSRSCLVSAANAGTVSTEMTHAAHQSYCNTELKQIINRSELNNPVGSKQRMGPCSLHSQDQQVSTYPYMRCLRNADKPLCIAVGVLACNPQSSARAASWWPVSQQQHLASLGPAVPSAQTTHPLRTLQVCISRGVVVWPA